MKREKQRMGKIKVFFTYCRTNDRALCKNEWKHCLILENAMVACTFNAWHTTHTAPHFSCVINNNNKRERIEMKRYTYELQPNWIKMKRENKKKCKNKLSAKWTFDIIHMSFIYLCFPFTINIELAVNIKYWLKSISWNRINHLSKRILVQYYKRLSIFSVSLAYINLLIDYALRRI